jgi:hypothetical protein
MSSYFALIAHLPTISGHDIRKVNPKAADERGVGV